ncbi:FAD dependent oxidoreductase [Hypoxylon sp. NC0597]|nr:FAD dependent oxidoreductase [Hypoxylon sp. NC0597]
MPHIVVLGAGVIGLSSALRIQAEGHAVTIVARDFPAGFETIDAQSQINFTSPWGGAHNRLVPPTNPSEEREHAMSLRTFDHMRAVQARYPEAGITFMKGIEYLEAPSEAYRALTEERARQQLGMQGFRLLGKEELPEGVKWGCEYDTWCVNPMVYCSFLLRRFAILGGKVLRQTCLVANQCPATITRQNTDGSWTFCVPRNFDGGTIIGGTKEPNNWNPNPSLEVREALLKKFAATYPQILGPDGKYTVIKDIVGRRPTRRGGIRLEKEKVDENRTVIHAYGLGGRGYELSWGVADGVAQLLVEHLESSTSWYNAQAGEAKL